MEGMTLYNILEKVDLLNFSFEDDVIDDSLNKTEPPSKDNGKINVGFSDKRSSAYLGISRTKHYRIRIYLELFTCQGPTYGTWEAAPSPWRI